MKNFFRNLFIVTNLLLLVSVNVQASHYTGAELTYECQGNGSYIFKVKFYRDCNGIAPGTSLNINTTVPGIPTIVLNLISQTDINAQGFQSNGDSLCLTCANSGLGNPTLGIVEEYVYESAPTAINGVPPATGWEFRYSDCCRNAMLTNIVNGGAQGYSLVAKMYSPGGQNTYPCFDSSPQFVDHPTPIICAGQPFIYNFLADDNEMDSLNYEFTDPLDDNGLPISFEPGYSVSSPLPGLTQNGSNISAVLDSSTGALSFTSFTGGYYTISIKVKAFQCGNLISEINRNVSLVISNNCATMMGGNPNYSPSVNAPFIDTNTGLYTSYHDTVTAGDLVNFTLYFTDFDIFQNGMASQITFNSFGKQYGTNYTDSQNGCLIPPCATLSQNLPMIMYIGGGCTFNWNTTVAHLGYSFSCVQFHNTYYFLDRVSDNYCPSNGVDSRVFSITVMPVMAPPIVTNNFGVLECNLTGGYIYQWFLNGVAIPGATSSTYTPTQPGFYQVLAVAPNGDGNYSNRVMYNPLGLYENELFNSLFVKPNPTKDGNIVIAGDLIKDSNFDVTITDLLGQKLSTNNFHELKGAFSIPINLSAQPNGVYIMKIESEKRVVKAIRVEVVR